MTKMQIQFGSLQHIFGQAAAHDGFTFVPAIVELDGDGFSTSCYLGDAVGEHPPPILACAVERRFDAAWVRARLPLVFGFTPERSEEEKSLLYVGFVAVATETMVGYPFICTDSYGRTGLLFSPDGPEEEMQARIAAKFWALLLKAPDDVEDFAATVFHPGAGIWMHFGCEDGKPTYIESEEQD